MDMNRRNQDGVTPLMGVIGQLEQATTLEQLFEIHLQLAPQSTTGFLNTSFDADEKNAKQNILIVTQGGLALKQREYYVDTDEATVTIREAYKQHIVKMMQLFGFTEQQATGKMTNIMRLETELAKVSRTKTELRDPEANYNKMTLAQFEANYPHLQLQKMMEVQGVAPALIQELVVGQPDFFAGADKVIAALTVDEYRDFLEWGEVVRAAEYLDEQTQATYFEFFGKVLSGRQEDYPLWQRSTKQIEKEMGEALGKMFVEKYFPAANKARMLQLVDNLREALIERFDAQDWMSDATKAQAKDKLNAFLVKVGYPDEWTDMSALTIDPQKSYYENILACKRFQNELVVKAKAGKPVDRNAWQMTPQTVNAYYNPTTNEICFPAGILQPPFFSMEADDAFMISSMMCLMALTSNAQVMTSATVDKVYNTVSQTPDAEFVYNADRDADGNIAEMVVYQEQPQRKGSFTMKPVHRYQYTYAADGMLTSRTKYVWHKNQWQCAGRHNYSLDGGCYTATYSRWNKKKAQFDMPVGQITYTLLPDASVAHVVCYTRQRSKTDMQLEWQASVESHTMNMDHYLTQK